MSMQFISSAIAAYRSFSSKSTNKSTRLVQISSSFKNKKNEPTNPSAKIKWTDKQSQILFAISTGQSVFITGSAGTGKTVLIKHVVKLLKKIHGPSRVFVTAPTGVAACALNGQTLHSFAGIGFAKAVPETLLHRVVSNKRTLKRWHKVKALVVDEISMVDADFFENLEYIARETHYEFGDKPWGGIQLVVSGDFFQLPPIIGNENSTGKVFAFEADCWNSSFDLQVELTRVFRQSDSQLIKLLQGIRRGESDPKDLELLKQCCSGSMTQLDHSMVRLYPRNQDVNRINKERMGNLDEEIVTYTALDSGEDPWKTQLKQGIAPDELEVCVGARVMLIMNIDTKRKLVNGASGTVTGFFESNDMTVTDICCSGLLPIVKFDSGLEFVIEPDTWYVMEGDLIVARRKQIPLILAWALSIHKCQGMTLDSLHTNLSRAFGCGMVYVALSRVRSLDGLHLSGFHPSKIKAHPKVLQFYQNFASKQDKQGEDDGANKNEIMSSNLHDASDTTSGGGTKYYLSFFKYRNSRGKDK